jgi:hypothetical protein
MNTFNESRSLIIVFEFFSRDTTITLLLVKNEKIVTYVYPDT